MRRIQNWLTSRNPSTTPTNREQTADPEHLSSFNPLSHTPTGSSSRAGSSLQESLISRIPSESPKHIATMTGKIKEFDVTQENAVERFLDLYEEISPRPLRILLEPDLKRALRKSIQFRRNQQVRIQEGVFSKFAFSKEPEEKRKFLAGAAFEVAMLFYAYRSDCFTIDGLHAFLDQHLFKLPNLLPYLGDNSPFWNQISEGVKRIDLGGSAFTVVKNTFTAMQSLAMPYRPIPVYRGHYANFNSSRSKVFSDLMSYMRAHGFDGKDPATPLILLDIEELAISAKLELAYRAKRAPLWRDLLENTAALLGDTRSHREVVRELINQFRDWAYFDDIVSAAAKDPDPNKKKLLDDLVSAYGDSFAQLIKHLPLLADPNQTPPLSKDQTDVSILITQLFPLMNQDQQQAVVAALLAQSMSGSAPEVIGDEAKRLITQLFPLMNQDQQQAVGAALLAQLTSGSASKVIRDKAKRLIIQLFPLMNQDQQQAVGAALQAQLTSSSTPQVIKDEALRLQKRIFPEMVLESLQQSPDGLSSVEPFNPLGLGEIDLMSSTPQPKCLIRPRIPAPAFIPNR